MAILKCDLDPNDYLVYRHPENTPPYGSTLIVSESQEALILNSGKLISVLSPGAHTIESINIPVIGNLFQDNKESVPIDIWFINKVSSTNFRWGTRSPVEVQDIEYRMAMPVGAYGNLQAKLLDAMSFILQVVGVRQSYSIDELRDFITPLIEMEVKDQIAEYATKYSVLTISSQLKELSNDVCLALKNRLSDLGIDLIDFYFQNVAIISSDDAFQKLKDALAESAAIKIQSKSIEDSQKGYEIMRRYDVLDKMAENEGNGMSDIASLGVGIGAAAGLSRNLAPNLFTSDQPQNSSQAESNNTLDALKNELTKAKDMMESGLLNQAEYDRIKESVIKKFNE